MIDISTYIINGMINGYHQNLVLKTSWDSLQSTITEYLFTVNIAQELIKWNEANNYNNAIHLEEDATTFLRKGFENETTWDDFLNSEIAVAKSKKSTREGKIDIAIYNSNNNRSHICIEVKSIIDNYADLILDIDRLSHTIGYKDKAVKSSISEGYSVFLRRIGGEGSVSSDKGLDSTKSKVLNKTISDHLKANKFKDLVNYQVINFSIAKVSGSDLSTRIKVTNEEIDYSEASEGSGEVFGALIKITKK